MGSILLEASPYSLHAALRGDDQVTRHVIGSTQEVATRDALREALDIVRKKGTPEERARLLEVFRQRPEDLRNLCKFAGSDGSVRRVVSAPLTPRHPTLMRNPLMTPLAALLPTLCPAVQAQHCQPIYESYLSLISVQQAKGRIKFRLQYTVQGGPGQSAYQAYWLAYLEKDAARVPAPAPKDVIDTEAALALHTELIRRNKEGVFDLEFEIAGGDLAKKMIAHRKLTEKDRTVNGGWGMYKDRIRIAVFIPLLDDKKYSVIEGLPKDRHYCNYDDDRALLFQTLPYRLSMHFGIVRALTRKPGRFIIEVNGDKPAKKKE